MAFKYKFDDLKKKVQATKRRGDPPGSYLPRDVNEPITDFVRTIEPGVIADIESIESMAAHETLVIVPANDPHSSIEVKFNYGIAEGYNLNKVRKTERHIIYRKRHIKNSNVYFGKKDNGEEQAA